MGKSFDAGGEGSELEEERVCIWHRWSNSSWKGRRAARDLQSQEQPPKHQPHQQRSRWRSMFSSGRKRVNVEVHFAKLTEVLMTAIEFGIDSAPEICVERVRSLWRNSSWLKNWWTHIFSYTTCCSPSSKNKCAIFLWKPLTTAWTRGSMS